MIEQQGVCLQSFVPLSADVTLGGNSGEIDVMYMTTEHVKS